MAIWGIIAEYHPFHNGHQYQLNRIKETDPNAVIVVAMSGNFVQRGAPAMMDKWMRTEMALAGGADLVMELPVIFAVQAADFFARGGISVLSQMKIDYLSFGSEAGTTGDFFHDAQLFLKYENQLFEKIRSHSLKDLSYPQAFAVAAEELSLRFSTDLTEPNNLLAFTYAKEIIKQNVAVQIRPLKRIGASHHDVTTSENSQFGSGTAIRRLIRQGKKTSQYLPPATEKLLHDSFQPYITWEHYWPYLKYQLTVSSLSQLQTVYQMNNGLENLLKQSALTANSYSDFLKKIKTKAYTQTRLERLLIYTLLDWKQTNIVQELNQPAHLRVLGFSSRGQQYLRKLRQIENIRPDTVIGRENREKYEKDIQAGQIYCLAATDKIKIQDYTRKPVQKH